MTSNCRIFLALLLTTLAIPGAGAEDAAWIEGPEGLEYARIRFLEQPYDVVRVDLREARLELFWKDDRDRPYQNFSRLRDRLRDEGRKLVFATNSGIYGKDRKPLGLHVAGGTELQRLNHGPGGGGNFYLKPNGVFFVEEGRAAILETGAYAAANPAPSLAVQSGPLLLDRGTVHHRFIPGSDSTFIRNGVGVVDEHTAVFVVSLYPVNFHDFTRFFLEVLSCTSALYLDGSLSSMYVSFADRTPRGSEFVGILGVAVDEEGGE